MNYNYSETVKELMERATKMRKAISILYADAYDVNDKNLHSHYDKCEENALEALNELKKAIQCVDDAIDCLYRAEQYSNTKLPWDMDMLCRLSKRGYRVYIHGNGAEIKTDNWETITTVEGDNGLRNWMIENGFYDD